MKKKSPKRKAIKKVRKAHMYHWGEVVNGEKRYVLHAGQTKALRSKRRFTAAIAGTGGGKTVLGPLWIVQRVQLLLSMGITSGLVGMVVAPTYKILSRATVPTLVETLRGTELEGRFIESKGHYVLPHGIGILYLLSADNPDGLEGGQLNIGAWLDEAGQMTYKAWLAICRRTGVFQSPILITTTPYLSNWLKTEVLASFLSGDEDYMAVNWRSLDNPAYPRAEYERAKRTLTKSAFDLMYNGVFGSIEGLVYPGFGLCVVDPINVTGRRIGGIDFGWRAPFCALSGVIYSNNGLDVLYVDQERYATQTRLTVHSRMLPRASVWFADPSEPEQIGDLRAFGHVVRKARNDVALGIEEVNARILSGRLKVSSSCTNLITEASMYQYPQASDVDEKPMVGMDHAMDALRYMCLSISRRKRYKIKTKRVHVRKSA